MTKMWSNAGTVGTAVAYAASGARPDALLLGPLADLGVIDGVTPTADCVPGRAAGPAGVREVLRQCAAELVAVRGAEVDFVFRAVEAEADGSGCLAAVEVIDKQRLNFPGHEMILIPSGEGKHVTGPRATGCPPVISAGA